MISVEEIEARLKARNPSAGNGDHRLNPGLEIPVSRRDAAVLILLVPRQDGLHIVFTERTPNLSAHAGQISFPGGGIEPSDRDETAAALREAAEEIGLNAANARVIGTLDDYVTRSGFRVRPVVALLETDQNWIPSPQEVARIFEVPLSCVLQGGIVEESMTFEGGERRFYALNWQNFHIWGATAGILKNFADALSPPCVPATPCAAKPRVPQP